MLKLWLAHTPLFVRAAVWCGSAMLFVGIFVSIPVAYPRGAAFEMVLAITGFAFASAATSKEALGATVYFAGLPLDAFRARRVTLEAGFAMLTLVSGIGLLFVGSGLAERWATRLFLTAPRADSAPVIPYYWDRALDWALIPALTYTAHLAIRSRFGNKVIARIAASAALLLSCVLIFYFRAVAYGDSGRDMRLLLVVASAMLELGAVYLLGSWVIHRIQTNLEVAVSTDSMS